MFKAMIQNLRTTRKLTKDDFNYYYYLLDVLIDRTNEYIADHDGTNFMEDMTINEGLKAMRDILTTCKINRHNDSGVNNLCKLLLGKSFKDAIKEIKAIEKLDIDYQSIDLESLVEEVKEKARKGIYQGDAPLRKANYLVSLQA